MEHDSLSNLMPKGLDKVCKKYKCTLLLYSDRKISRAERNAITLDPSVLLKLRRGMVVGGVRGIIEEWHH